MTVRWRNWGMDCLVGEDGKVASHRSRRLFSGQNKIRQNPLLMDCLPKESLHLQFAAIKLSPPSAWDFLGVREICAECWRREFQGKFSFVSSLHIGTIRKHFLGSWRLHRRKRIEMLLASESPKGHKQHPMRSVGQGYVSSFARVMVIAEICNFSPSCQQLLACYILINTIPSPAKGREVNLVFCKKKDPQIYKLMS